MKLKLKNYDHPYYCSEMNYFVSPKDDNWGSRKVFKNWKAFDEAWDLEHLDIDMNLIFRWDIWERDEAGFGLSLYMMHQRKGAFRPIEIETIEKKDLEEINNYLREHWIRLQQMWNPISVIDESTYKVGYTKK